MIWKSTFTEAIADAWEILHKYGREVDVGHWQGVPTEGRPDMVTVEVMGYTFTCPIPQPKPEECAMEQPLFMLRDEIQPNLPWADDHFEERVSRVPSNPGEAYRSWPWWRGQDDKTMAEGKFTHTYQERFWPDPGIQGIRYAYGDLDDVVKQLLHWPHGRQAYLPIFFPEDTGTVHGGRVPCTLGYHFMMRHNHLHMWYFIRSCDFIRHFRDDLYLAARLQLWVLEELQRWSARWEAVTPGNFTFVCPSLHYHRGDEHHIKS